MLGFDADKIHYSKPLFKGYEYTTPLSETSTSIHIDVFVENEEEGADYVNVFIYSIVPARLRFDIEGILSSRG